MYKPNLQTLSELQDILSRKNRAIQITFFYLLTIVMTLLSVPFQWALSKVDPKEGGPESGYFTLLVLAPLIETLVFQYLVFLFIRNIISKPHPLLYIVISSVCFALTHSYNLPYIVYAFFMGLVLAYMFQFYSDNLKNAFWCTALVHCLRNLTTAILISTIAPAS